jgi:molybdate transport repressor ModE-like protein
MVAPTSTLRTLDVRRMRVLREVAGRGTIAAAARALSFTPSAVSQQLAALEREAGVPLLDRHGGRVRLTEAGRRLVARTESILAELEAASAELSAAAADVTGDIHVAAFPSAERALLAPAIATLLDRHPDVRVRTTELEPEASLPALRLGDVDLIVSHEDVSRPVPPDARLERVDLLEDPLRVVLPPGHPADRDPIVLADLAGASWVATPPGTACRAMLEHACRAAGFVPDVPFHANDFGVLAAFVAAGLGVAMVPELALDAFGPDVAIRPVADVPVTRRLYAAARRGGLERPALAAMVQALREAAAQTATRSGLWSESGPASSTSGSDAGGRPALKK